MYALRDTLASSLQPADRRRLLVAIVCSAIVHAWFAHVGAGGPVSRTNPEPAKSLAVTLNVLPSVVSADVAPVEATIPPHIAAPPARHVALSREESTPRVTPAEISPAVQHDSSAVADPTYYGARELDVYPSLAVPLDLERIRASDSARARVQLLLLISDAGHVEEVTVVSAEATANFEHEARRVFLSARFVPGQRGGRRVKSRLLVEVTAASAR